MKIPESLYLKSNVGFTSNVLKNAIETAATSTEDFLGLLKNLKNHPELTKWSHIEQIAQLLDACDSILEKNNSEEKGVIDEKIASRILKFFERGFENIQFCRLFCSLDRVLFILNWTDSFECVQLALRICQNLMRYSDDPILANHPQALQLITAHKGKLLDYVKISLQHMKIFNKEKDQLKFPLCSIYYDDQNIDKVLKQIEKTQEQKKDSSLRKGSLQGRILRASCDLQMDQVEETSSWRKDVLAEELSKKVIEVVITLEQSQEEKKEEVENPTKNQKVISIDFESLNLNGISCIEATKKVIEQNNLKIEIDSSQWRNIRFMMMFRKHIRNTHERKNMIYFFINGFKIYTKCRTSIILKDFKAQHIIEELISIFRLNCPPILHSHIVRVIRYYGRSHTGEHSEFLLSALAQVANLDSTGNQSPESKEGQNEVVPHKTACNHEFQKQLIGLLGDKNEQVATSNLSSLAVSNIIKISDSLIRSSEQPAPLKLMYNLEVITKTQNILTHMMKNEEINREHNIFEKHLLPQYLILLSLPSHTLLPLQLNSYEEDKLKRKQNSIPTNQGKEGEEIEIQVEKIEKEQIETVQLWKEVTIEELYERLTYSMNLLNLIFRGQQQLRGNTALSRKISATNFFDLLAESLSVKYNPEFFLSSLVLVFRIVNEQPALINTLIQKKLISLQLDTLSKEPLPKDSLSIKSILQYITIVSIVEEGKTLAISSGVLAKVFTAFTKKEYIECFSQGGVSEDPNVISPLTAIAEVIAKNVRGLEQNTGAKPLLIELLSQTMAKLIKTKDQFIDLLREENQEFEYKLSESYLFYSLLENFCKFYLAICQREAFFLRNSERFGIFDQFLQLVRFPILNSADNASKLGLVIYAMQLGKLVGQLAIACVHLLINKELAYIQELLGCENQEQFLAVKDLSSVFLDSLPFHSKEIDLSKVQQFQQHNLFKPLLLSTSLLYLNGLVSILTIGIRCKTDTAIQPSSFSPTLTQLYHLYAIMIGQQVKEEISWLRRHTRDIDEQGEQQSVHQFNQHRKSLELKNVGSSLRGLFRAVLGPKSTVITQNWQGEIYCQSIAHLLKNVIQLEPVIAPQPEVQQLKKEDEKEGEVKTEIANDEKQENTIKEKEENKGEQEVLASLTENCWITQIEKVIALDVGIGYFSSFLKVYVEEIKLKGIVDNEQILDLGCLAHLLYQRVLHLFGDSVKAAISLVSDYAQRDKKQYQQGQLFFKLVMQGLSDKLSQLIQEFFITSFDISQEIYVKGQKELDLKMEPLANGISYYFLETLEDIAKDNLVKLQGDGMFLQLVEVILNKIDKAFSLVNSEYPLKTDLQKSIREKKKKDEEAKLKKFNTEVQMIVDMGFSKRRAAEALRRYQEISLAVEYLTRQQFAIEPNNLEQEQEEPPIQEIQRQQRPNNRFQRSVDLSEIESTEEVGSDLKKVVPKVSGGEQEYKIQLKKENSLKIKIKQFTCKTYSVLLTNMLKFGQTEALVCDLIIKHYKNSFQSSSASEDVNGQIALDEIALTLLWNLKEQAALIGTDKFSLKIPLKVLPSEFKPKAAFEVGAGNSSQIFNSICSFSRTLFAVTKMASATNTKIIMKKSVGFEIVRFCRKVSHYIILQSDTKGISGQDQITIKDFLMRCLLFGNCLIESSQLSNSLFSQHKLSKDAKADKSASSLLINTSKDDSLLSKNKDDSLLSKLKDDSMLSKQSKLDKSLALKGDLPSEIVKLLAVISDISKKENCSLTNKSVQGILSILSQLIEKDKLNKIAKQIQESGVFTNILNSTNLNSMEGIFDSLCNFYSSALNNDTQAQTVFLEAKIKSFFLFHKHKNLLQDSISNNTSQNNINVQAPATSGVAPATQEESPSVNKEQKQLRVPMEVFLQFFTHYSQSSVFTKVFSRICLTKKEGGKEWIELNKDTNINRVQLGHGQQQQINSSGISKKSAINLSVNSSGLSSSQMMVQLTNNNTGTNVNMQANKQGYSANFVPQEPTSSLLGELIETFVTKLVKRISKFTQSSTSSQPAKEQQQSADNSLPPHQPVQQPQPLAQQPSPLAQSELEVDEGLLLHVIHFITKKFPVLVPFICKYRVFKTVAKVLKTDQACSELLSLPQQHSPSQQTASKPEKHATFLQFFSRVVLSHCQHFARDLLLELCIDSFVMRSSKETYASEIRNQILNDAHSFLTAKCLQISTSPLSLLHLVTYGQVMCLLLNLKQLKNSAGKNQPEFLSIFSKCLSSLKRSQYFDFEQFLPFITHPLAILHRYALSNILKKQKTSDKIYLYQSQAAQFVPLKYGITHIQSHFAQAWNKVMYLNPSNNVEDILSQYEQQQLLQEQEAELDEQHNLDMQAEWILVDEDNGDLEVPIYMPELEEAEEFQQQLEEAAENDGEEEVEEEHEEEDNDNEEVLQQVTQINRANILSEGNQTLILENSLSQEASTGNAYEPGTIYTYEENFESEEGVSELEVQGNRFNQDEQRDNNNILQTQQQNNRSQGNYEEEEEDVFEDEEEYEDIEDDDEDVPEVVEESKDSSELQNPHNELRNQENTQEAKDIMKNIRKWLKFDEKTLMSQQVAITSLQEQQRKLMSHKLLGNDLLSVYETQQHLEKNQANYFLQSNYKWNSLSYKQRVLSPVARGQSQQQLLLQEGGHFQQMMLEVLQREGGSYERQVRELLRQIEQNGIQIGDEVPHQEENFEDYSLQWHQNRQQLQQLQQQEGNLLGNMPIRFHNNPDQANRQPLNDYQQSREESQRAHLQMMNRFRDLLLLEAVDEQEHHSQINTFEREIRHYQNQEEEEEDEEVEEEEPEELESNGIFAPDYEELHGHNRHMGEDLVNNGLFVIEEFNELHNFNHHFHQGIQPAQQELTRTNLENRMEAQFERMSQRFSQLQPITQFNNDQGLNPIRPIVEEEYQFIENFMNGGAPFDQTYAEINRMRNELNAHIQQMARQSNYGVQEPIINIQQQQEQPLDIQPVAIINQPNQEQPIAIAPLLQEQPVTIVPLVQDQPIEQTITVASTVQDQLIDIVQPIQEQHASIVQPIQEQPVQIVQPIQEQQIQVIQGEGILQQEIQTNIQETVDVVKQGSNEIQNNNQNVDEKKDPLLDQTQPINIPDTSSSDILKIEEVLVKQQNEQIQETQVEKLSEEVNQPAQEVIPEEQQQDPAKLSGIDGLTEEEREELRLAILMAEEEFDRMNQEFEEQEEQQQVTAQEQRVQEHPSSPLQQPPQQQQPVQQQNQEQQQQQQPQQQEQQPQPVQQPPAQEEQPDFLQRSIALLQQFDLDIGFFERNELDPLYFDELPEDIKMEIILTYLPQELARQDAARAAQVPAQQPAQGQNQQPAQVQPPTQPRQAEQQNVPRPRQDEADTVSFLASLPPQLRDEILLTASPEVLGQIPEELREHALRLQQRGVVIHNQEAEVQELRKRELKKIQEQQRKKLEFKQKILKEAKGRKKILADNTLCSSLGQIADETTLQKLIEFLYIGGDSFVNFPYSLFASFQMNPLAEFKLLDAMMFILRSPGIAIMKNNSLQNEDQDGEEFPPSQIVNKPDNKKKQTFKEIYTEVAQKAVFLLIRASEKHVFYFIDTPKQNTGLSKISTIESLQESTRIKKMPFSDLAQLLTSEAAYENQILLELLIRLLHNIAKKYYSFHFEEGHTVSSHQSLSVKSICQVLSSDHLSKLSLKRLSEIINYMCFDSNNLADFIGELKNIIMLFTEDINSIFDMYLPTLRQNPTDPRPFKNIQEHLQGVSKVQKMITIIKELFEKSQSVKIEEQIEEQKEDQAKKEETEKKNEANKKDNASDQIESKEHQLQLSRIRDQIQTEFVQLAQDNSLHKLWINLAELFSIIGENHSQAQSQSILLALQPLLESFLVIQVNLSPKKGAETTTVAASTPVTLPSLTPSVSNKLKTQTQNQAAELQIAHLSFSEVRLRKITSQALFYFVCEKSKSVINGLIRNKLKAFARKQNYEGTHRDRYQFQSILSEPVGVVFKQIPRIVDFENKKLFFQLEITNIKFKSQDAAGPINCRIRRKEVLVDSYYAINQLSKDTLKGRLRIEFDGEEGIDAGGLTREWFVILSKEIFNPNYCLFLPSQSGNTFQPNPNSHINNQDKQYFKFVGRIVGKALFDGYMLDAYFTRSFYKHMLGQEITYHDIQDQDNEFYKSMKWTVENDVTPLDLTFIYERELFGKHEEIELVPGGKNLAVTEENKIEYVNLICHTRMTKHIQDQIRFFLEGFHDIIPADIISVFDSHELELMISGLPDIDLVDLKENTEYHNYKKTDPIIKWFWEILESYDRTQKAAFIQFVTGTSKVPLDGFSHLKGIQGIQKFQIHQSYHQNKLPTTHTCFNQLDLPNYGSKEILSEKLTYAILEGKEGFGFA